MKLDCGGFYVHVQQCTIRGESSRQKKGLAISINWQSQGPEKAETILARVSKFALESDLVKRGKIDAIALLEVPEDDPFTAAAVTAKIIQAFVAVALQDPHRKTHFVVVAVAPGYYDYTLGQVIERETLVPST